VFCHWLAWLLRVKTSAGRDVNLKSVLDKHETHCNHTNNHVTQAPATDFDEDGTNTQTGMMVRQ